MWKRPAPHLWRNNYSTCRPWMWIERVRIVYSRLESYPVNASCEIFLCPPFYKWMIKNIKRRITVTYETFPTFPDVYGPEQSEWEPKMGVSITSRANWRTLDWKDLTAAGSQTLVHLYCLWERQSHLCPSPQAHEITLGRKAFWMCPVPKTICQSFRSVHPQEARSPRPSLPMWLMLWVVHRNRQLEKSSNDSRTLVFIV